MAALTPDLCIVGTGAGSFAAAAAAVARRRSVILIDAGGAATGSRHAAALGLVEAARHADALRRAADFGMGAAAPEIDFRDLGKRIQVTAAALAPNHALARLGAMGVRIIAAPARFRDKRTLIAGDTEIRARHFVLCVGSVPAVPAIAGLGAVEHFTADTIASIARKPGHLVVMGGGALGMELAQAFRRLGCEVTVVEAEHALGDFDPEMSEVVLRRLRAEGVAILEKTHVEAIERRGKGGLRLNLLRDGAASSIDGTHLFLATGRRLNLSDLALAKAGLAETEHGVAVSAALRTANRRIFAIGETIAPDCPRHVAEIQAERVVRYIQTGRQDQAEAVPVSHVVLTDPELAHVGIAEPRATKARQAIRIIRWPYAENERALAAHRPDGHVKLVVDPAGKILGVSIVGAAAGEAIGLWALAMAKQMTLADIAGTNLPTSTFSEIGRRAALSYLSAEAASAVPSKLARLLRVFRA